MNNLKNIFSVNLNKLMANHNESVTDLAKSIGTAYSTVSDWKNCKKMPRSGGLQKIADHYHINISDLLEEVVDKEDSSNLDWTDLGMAYGGHIPDDLKDMYRAIAEEYVKKHPEALQRDKNNK
ncbi:XRE family transcriptional regulator [Lactobacillus sp. ESL0236]|uniref:helix-turn-helix domain-containing protein n=1 Tax=unclassified Lactobacillus TaxID=2620435 RepID=UPI000EFA7C3E|nr:MULTISPECIES: helix-turn-helix transcriptional regulator [unclassified Lactobacillus]RMC36955.1 XRE family transcriptional regulator [Lactobacillus sp. ESL0237]RMC42479.1 XRE family transcriptional regulator [Lactobacillus sp. ESL0234]RMC43177.1 XRE family transcriptional regulator [Lactobacillus sp. ESL0236]